MQFPNNMFVPPDRGHLSVKGGASLEVDSDLARLNIGITTQDKSLEKAKDANNRISSLVLASLYDYGISKENINTKDVNVIRNYDYSNYQLLSYSVSNLITVLVSDFKKLNDIISLAIENGANDNISIDFILSNPTMYYNRALKKASQDAINKASLLAKSFDVQYNPTPYKIVEYTSPLYAIQYSSSANYGYPSDISPGSVKISAEVEAFFNTFQQLN